MSVPPISSSTLASLRQPTRSLKSDAEQPGPIDEACFSQPAAAVPRYSLRLACQLPAALIGGLIGAVPVFVPDDTGPVGTGQLVPVVEDAVVRPAHKTARRLEECVTLPRSNLPEGDTFSWDESGLRAARSLDQAVREASQLSSQVADLHLTLSFDADQFASLDGKRPIFMTADGAQITPEQASAQVVPQVAHDQAQVWLGGLSPSSEPEEARRAALGLVKATTQDQPHTFRLSCSPELEALLLQTPGARLAPELGGIVQTVEGDTTMLTPLPFKQMAGAEELAVRVRGGRPVLESVERVRPEPHRQYAIEVGDQRRAVPVTFTAQACDWIRSQGLAADLDQAVLLASDGTTLPLDHRGSGGLTDADPPYSFLLQASSNPVFGHPARGLEVDWRDGKLISRPLEGEIFTEFKVLRSDRDDHLEKLILAGSVPKAPGALQTDSWVSIPLAEGAAVHAPNQQLASLVEQEWHQMLGRRLHQPRESLDYAAAVAKLSGALGVEKLGDLRPEDQERLQTALLELLGPGMEQVPFAQLVTEFARRTDRGRPLQIVVLPKNKDVADYLGYDPIGADVSESSRRAGVAELPLKPGQPTAARVLYIGEELLREDAKIILQHELLHVFEERYATDEELDVIDAAHERARAAKGPYPSLYGAERREFLTTLGEEYLNSRGPEGRAWVQHHYPEVYGILDRLLG